MASMSFSSSASTWRPAQPLLPVLRSQVKPSRMMSSKGPHSSPSVASVSWQAKSSSESDGGGSSQGTCKNQLLLCTYRIHHDPHPGPRPPEAIQQALELPVDEHQVDVGQAQHVSDIVVLEAVVDGDDDGAGGDDAVDALEEGRGVGHEHADAAEGVGLQKIGEAAGAVGKLLVGAAQGGAVGGDVHDGLGTGLDGGGAREEGGRGEGVDVVRVWVARLGGV